MAASISNTVPTPTAAPLTPALPLQEKKKKKRKNLGLTNSRSSLRASGGSWKSPPMSHGAVGGSEDCPTPAGTDESGGFSHFFFP